LSLKKPVVLRRVVALVVQGEDERTPSDSAEVRWCWPDPTEVDVRKAETTSG